MKSELDRDSMSLPMATFRQRLILAGITPILVDDEIAKSLTRHSGNLRKTHGSMKQPFAEIPNCSLPLRLNSH